VVQEQTWWKTESATSKLEIHEEKHGQRHDAESVGMHRIRFDAPCGFVVLFVVTDPEHALPELDASNRVAVMRQRELGSLRSPRLRRLC
jgi:hypothetical protein